MGSGLDKALGLVVVFALVGCITMAAIAAAGVCFVLYGLIRLAL